MEAKSIAHSERKEQKHDELVEPHHGKVGREDELRLYPHLEPFPLKKRRRPVWPPLSNLVSTYSFLFHLSYSFVG